MKSKFGVRVLMLMGLALGSSLASAQVWDDPFAKHDTSAVDVPGVDKDGDGCLSKSEITPGSQLEKRFSTRDANGDGMLCKDEYFFP